MSDRPLTSVVIDNYNYARFLVEAIESALVQTYAPLEVVVVDDGSTDQSREVIAGYGDRITPVLKVNGGMGSALNAGFAACSGDVVVFLDSDDMLLPTAVEIAVRLLDDPAVVKVHWPMWEVSEAGEKTGRVVPRKPLPEGDLRQKVIKNGPVVALGSPTSGNAWSRRYLERVLPMPERELKQHADSYLNTLACLFGGIRSVSEPQGQYRLHGTNDYATRPENERARRNLEMYHYRCRLLSQHLHASGVDVQPDTWKTGNLHYANLLGRHALLEELATLMPVGETFILVDQGTRGDGVIIAGRGNVRFTEQVYGNPWRPPDDQAAIRAVERLRAAGAGFIVFVRPTFWWLTCYTGLDRHLRARYCCVLRNDRTIVFDLR